MQFDDGRQPAFGIPLAAGWNRRRGNGGARQQQGQHTAGDQGAETGFGGWHVVFLGGG